MHDEVNEPLKTSTQGGDHSIKAGPLPAACWYVLPVIESARGLNGDKNRRKASLELESSLTFAEREQRAARNGTMNAACMQTSITASLLCIRTALLLRGDDVWALRIESGL